MNPLYYDRDGSVISQKEWATKHDDVFYKIVSRSTVRRGIVVSTVWLGINHDWTEEGPPIIFETMVFGGPCNEEMDRYCTEEQAIVGHFEMIAHVLDCLEEEPHEESRKDNDGP